MLLSFFLFERSQNEVTGMEPLNFDISLSFPGGVDLPFTFPQFALIEVAAPEGATRDFRVRMLFFSTALFFTVTNR